jgi:hypothetical protein
MAYTLTGIPAYDKQEVAPILYKVIDGTQTAELIDKVGNIIPGIKSSESLPTILVDPIYQAGGCELTPTGSTTISQRKLTVTEIAVMEKMCEKDLNSIFLQGILKAGSNYDDVALRSTITELAIKQMALKNENLIWQGDITLVADANLKWIDGFIKLFDADGTVISLPTFPALATAGSARTGLKELKKNIPLRILNDPNTVILAGWDVLSAYQDDLATANHYHLMGNGLDKGVMPVENSHINIHAVSGLNGTKRAYVLNLKNLYIGTDLANEYESIDFTQDPIKKSLHYMQLAFKMGVQYFDGSAIVAGEWA